MAATSITYQYGTEIGFTEDGHEWFISVPGYPAEFGEARHDTDELVGMKDVVIRLGKETAANEDNATLDLLEFFFAMDPATASTALLLASLAE